MAPAGPHKPVVVAIVGPTCTGKTVLSLKLAELFHGEIIACDSRTIYRQMDIGTAKPSPAEQATIRHHMLDVVDPAEVYTVAQYKEAAQQAVDQAGKRGRLPIICGGTGFYARALLEGLEIPAVEPQQQLRAELKRQAEEHGNEYLVEKLAKLDPLSASRINTNDLFRLVRAIEVSTVLGRPFSELAGRVDPPYRTVWIGLTVDDRSILQKRIKERFRAQMQAGLLEEVERLLKSYGPCQTLANTVNYKEFVNYLQGTCSRAQAEELCLLHNNQLARRQLIWFRSNSQICWLPVDLNNERELVAQASRLIERAVVD
jgi:tRNA dimethylallyltransferase